MFNFFTAMTLLSILATIITAILGFPLGLIDPNWMWYSCMAVWIGWVMMALVILLE